MRNTIQSNTPTNKRDLWRTTDYCFRDAMALCGVHFDIDLAACPDSTKCSHYLDSHTDALDSQICWFLPGQVAAFCNPPFSRKVEFLQKAHEQRKNGLICMLLPYEPCTKWWRDNVDGKASVVYVPDGRYNFCDPETGKEIKGVNFSSAFVVFTGLTMPTQYVQFKRGVGNA